MYVYIYIYTHIDMVSDNYLVIHIYTPMYVCMYACMHTYIYNFVSSCLICSDLGRDFYLQHLFQEPWMYLPPDFRKHLRQSLDVSSMIFVKVHQFFHNILEFTWVYLMMGLLNSFSKCCFFNNWEKSLFGTYVTRQWIHIDPGRRWEISLS